MHFVWKDIAYWVYKTYILVISYMHYQYIALITYTSMPSFEANAIVSLVTLDIVSLVTLDIVSLVAHDIVSLLSHKMHLH
jgi:hypothetical protein